MLEIVDEISEENLVGENCLLLDLHDSGPQQYLVAYRTFP